MSDLGITITLPMKQENIGPTADRIMLRIRENIKENEALQVLLGAVQAQCEHPADQQICDEDPRGPSTTCKVCRRVHER